MVKTKPIQSIRGFRTLTGESLATIEHIEQEAITVAQDFGYQSIRLPILESHALFYHAAGQTTDIVSKEMYEFTDRNGDQLCLRPEGTASVVRASIEQGLSRKGVTKYWYHGPMFRHERPQKGRYRQFYQFGMECFGSEQPWADIELVLASWTLFKRLKIDHLVELQLNIMGNTSVRAAYCQALVDYCKPFYDQLPAIEQQRLALNPLRLLDSKNQKTQDLMANAPLMTDLLDDKQQEYGQQIKETLQSLGINFIDNPHLMRGLDYYNGLVFEWITHDLGAQGTVCAGGRYDGLSEALGGPQNPSVGMAYGIDRLAMLCQAPESPGACQCVWMGLTDEAIKQGLLIKKQWIESKNQQDKLRHISFEVDLQAGRLKNQLKRAIKQHADYALIVGEDELSHCQVMIKSLKSQSSDQMIDLTQCLDFMSTLA